MRQRGVVRGARDGVRAQMELERQTMTESWGGLFTVLGFRLVGWFFKKMWAWRVTLLWLAFLAGFFGSGKTAMIVFGVVLFVAPIVAGFWYPVFHSFCAFVPDWRRSQRKREQMRNRFNGQKFLVQAGIMSEEDAMDLEPAIDLVWSEDGDVATLTLWEPIPGLSMASFVRSARDFQNLLNAVRSSSTQLSDGAVEIVFYMTDPLDTPQRRDEAGALDPDKMRVECAVDEQGEPVSLTFGDVSGAVIGGIPGSGKTAGMTSFLLPMALSPYVDMYIFDGKGGSDWSSYGGAPATRMYLKGDETLEQLEAVRDMLRDLNAEMVARLDGQRERIGNSNFWNVDADDRLAGGERFKLVVLDEVQSLFEQAGRSKEEKAVMGEILRYLTSGVKRGRSAGFCYVFATQKPTTDSLPSGIRDNAGLRIAFRLTTAAAETAVLGALPDALDVPRAVDIPPLRKGGAVLATDTGEVRGVRFFYIDEKKQDVLLSAGSRAAVPPVPPPPPVVEEVGSDGEAESL